MKETIWKHAAVFWGKIKPFLCKTVQAGRCCGFWVSQSAPAVLWVFMAVCFVCLVWVLGSGGVPEALARAIGETQKPEVIKFIGWGMSGLLAAIVALALNRRADEMAKTNELTQEGHVNERFKSAVESLANANPSARIASFYQFYYLAKNNRDKDMVQNILDILCAHLQRTTCDEEYRKNTKPTEEIQNLLDLLFKSDDKTVFANMKIKLPRAHLVGADLKDPGFLTGEQSNSYANFHGADLRHANLQNAELQFADFSHANLWGTNFQGADLTGADLRGATLECADFTDAEGMEDAIFDETDKNDKP